MAFHSEIKVNYQVLQNIVSDLKKYEKALQSMQTSIANMDRIISENEGKTFVALGKIEHDFDDEIVKCKEEIRDIYTSISNYVSDMSGIIGASPAGSTVLVDRADIYCNKTSIKNACADIGRIGQNLYGHMVYSSAYEDRPNKFAEMQRDARRTSRMREAIQSSARKIDGYYQAIDNIYKNKIKKYENKDDDHEAKIIVIHDKYTGLKDRLRETVKVRWDFWKGVLSWGKDLIVGFAELFILARSLEVYFVYKIVRQDPPDWSKQRIEGLKGLKKLTPWSIVESLCQSGSDTLAEKGYAYGIGYVAPDVVIAVVTAGSGKAATSADDIARIGKTADRIDDIGDAVRTADKADDISDAARGVNKIDDLSDVSKGIKVGDTLEDGSKVVRISSAEEANKALSKGKYAKPPYAPDKPVYIIEASGKEHYVRVFDGSNSGKYGQWIMKYDDIKGLTPSQIRNKYALPTEPTRICDVNVPKGTELRTGTANPIEGWGKGGGQQFDLQGKRLPKESWSHERAIGDIVE